ncbi:glutaredoxin [Leptospira wolffii serovar Khorat str. Khorat-H2]|nr:glutaredoxin [Leptospira wolffii serovar Khorat str. Khorat-H2]
MCGFSAGVTNVLRSLGTDYGSFNVLSDQNVREGIKEFANWPTIPQLYVDGEFIGGHDIVVEMAKSGELQKKLGN